MLLLRSRGRLDKHQSVKQALRHVGLHMLGRMECTGWAPSPGLAREQAGPLSAFGIPTEDTVPIQNLEFAEAFQSITYGHESASIIQTD